MEYPIRSSSARLLKEASQIAREFADRYRRADIAGIVFLGAVARGYFDAAADVDVALLTNGDLGSDRPPLYHRVRGVEIHCWVSEYAKEASEPWPMAKRWAYSESVVHHDPEGRVAALIAEKTRLGRDERRWLLVSGAALSEWYVRRLTALWVERGSLLSAHGMIGQGLNHFFDLLFALNDRLVADHKWRLFAAERLPVLPDRFPERMADVMTTREITAGDLGRRVDAFMAMWSEMIPRVEREVGSTYEEFKDTV